VSRRHLDWIDQAGFDLKHAKSSIDLGDYEWACFAAQQAGEKALKALIESHNGKARGHSLMVLMKGMDIDDVELLKTGARLDKHYFPTRYPCFFTAGKPRDYYFQEDAEQAVKDAEMVISYCKANLKV